MLTISYRGLFRQEQYETVTVEGSLTLSSETDSEWFTASGDDLYRAMRGELYRLIRPVITEISSISRYDGHETVIYEWEKVISDEAGNTTASRQPARRRAQRS